METVKAYLNYGRWLVRCPKHGKNGLLEVTPQTKDYIAPCCFPGIVASFPSVIKGRVMQLPDVSARATARKLAQQAGEIYSIEFPENMQEILDIVKLRPIQNQNWIMGETIDQLQADNVANGI